LGFSPVLEQIPFYGVRLSVRVRRTTGIVLAVLVAYLILFALTRNTHPPVTMTVRSYATNIYNLPLYPRPTECVAMTIAVTNRSNKSFLCRADAFAWARFADLDPNLPLGFPQRTLLPHSGFIFEAFAFQGFTNKIEISFTASQPPWLYRVLPRAIGKRLPSKFQTPQYFELSTPGFYLDPKAFKPLPSAQSAVK
jgi:hypothetical protein